MGPRRVTMQQAQRAYDNMTPEDVYGSDEPNEDEDEREIDDADEEAE